MANGFSGGDSEFLHVFRVDEMTGLYNRVYFAERVREDMLRSKRYRWPVSVVLLSLDRFASFRELRGPVQSDNMLASIASMVRKFARDTDIAARYDDATFGLLLPGTGREGAEAIAERMRDRVSGHLLADDHGDVMQVTCSQGIAQFHPHMRQPDDLLRLAEHALRQAQEAGGDRFLVADASAVASSP